MDSLVFRRCFIKFFFVFLGRHPQHMEVPRLGVQSEPQLLAYTTATAMPDPSLVCDLHHSSWQCRILNPLSEAGDQTRNLMVPSQSRFCRAMTETPFSFCFLGLHPRHMEFPRIGVELGLQLLAYTTATAMPDLSHVCDLHCSP